MPKYIYATSPSWSLIKMQTPGRLQSDDLLGNKRYNRTRKKSFLANKIFPMQCWSPEMPQEALSRSQSPSAG